MAKAKVVVPYHAAPKRHWLILPGFRRLMPTPYVYLVPDLKLLKKGKLRCVN